MVLNQSRWQSLGGQHGKGVDGLFEKVSFQTAFEGVESGESLILRGSPFQTVGDKSLNDRLLSSNLTLKVKMSKVNITGSKNKSIAKETVAFC